MLAAPFRRAVDLALPPRCAGCGAIVAADHRFCAACWSSLRFLGPPGCAGCGLPFEQDRGGAARCADCDARPPRHAGVFAAVAYGAVSRGLALKLKYGGRLHLAETAARQMARLVPAGADLLVPVPLHRWRLWSRGYNQAGLIATAVSRLGGVPVRHDVLRRRRATVPLRGLSAAERARAVGGAFAVPPPAMPHLRGRAVVLIDDVLASGATADACVDALLRAGARSVAILCWARVIDATPD